MAGGMNNRIEVIKPGWFTTVQDLGRYGSQHYGVPVSGAMDRFATVVANRLAGNHDRAAVLECTLKGPELLFQQDTVIAVTGADLSPTIDDKSIPLWTCINAPRHSRLRFGTRRSGFRAYLAIAGGIDVPMVLGSRSTHYSSVTGGFQGRPLQPGDILSTGQSAGPNKQPIGKQLPDRLRPRYDRSVTLRIIPGPQQEYFSEDALITLTSSSYTITPQSDRMGYRLAGPKIVHTGSTHMISDGAVMGTVQVPSNEQPLLLMADGQTTGGYPKIGVVISADLPLAAQLMPGETIRFSTCTVAEAQTILRNQYGLLDAALPTR